VKQHYDGESFWRGEGGDHLHSESGESFLVQPEGSHERREAEEEKMRATRKLSNSFQFDEMPEGNNDIIIELSISVV
jgi:hypothetical protein